MKRWAIAKMVDAGDGNIESAFNRYRCNTRIWTKPGFSWCFGQIAAPSLVDMNADQDIYVLPEATLGMAVGSIPSAVRTTMRNKLEAGGFSFEGVKTTWTVKQLLMFLKGQLDPLGDIESGDVVDIEQ